MTEIISFFKTDPLGIQLAIYLPALVVVIAGFVGKKIVDLVFKRLIRLAVKTKLKFDDILFNALSKPLQWAMTLGGVFGALYLLPIPSEPINFVKFRGALFMAVYVSLVIWIAVRLVDGLSKWWGEVAKKTETKLDDQLVPIVRQGVKVFLYIVGVVFMLQNLGYSVLSLLAGFGLGGAALALASKDTVANVFGSIVIFFDKPFQIGDWIEMGSLEGTVEDVGLRTTRVRTFANSLVTVPNALFTTHSVNNWSKMKKRRIKMNIGVGYSASPEKVHQLVAKIREIIAADENLSQDYSLVNFNNFAPSSLDIFIYCFSKTTVWADYLDVRQAFMLKIMHAVYDLGLDFAFPTQTVHLESVPKEFQALPGAGT
ncbi:MAG: mechanosensitive ion channel family protein [bacterium]|nr:mechanosensitive ion channel family protein [bacterium]